MRQRKNTAILIAAMALLLVAACDRSVVYDEHFTVDENGWNMDEPIVFNIEAEDTSETCLCFLDIRNRNDYAFSNIFFFITTIYPNGEIAADTNIEFQLAMPDGKWLGKESGRYVDGRYPLCYFHFPEKGKYQFVIHHAMRDTLLAGIKDIGMHVERVTVK
ncbi:MAG: gliding motility lipoprotein GldH [Bacteroidales bacterium]|nr:gliding motility lipoprotein GldH [Bacteroidales bacterium]